MATNSTSTDGESAGSEAAADTPLQVIAGTTAIVDPAAYCQQCPHFDAASTTCSNASATILESLLDGRLHVADCPVVTADGPAFDRGQRD